MTTSIRYASNRRGTIKVTNLLVWCLAFWPFFWNIWGVFNVTTSIGSSIPMYCLWGISGTVVLIRRKLNKSFLLTWFVFLGVVVLESYSRPTAVIRDLSVILCGVLFCICLFDYEYNYHIILKTFMICGLIISIAVILDNGLGIIKSMFINLYTEEARRTKLMLHYSGGLLPHTGSAGGYIYSGLAACIGLTKEKGRRLNRINSIVLLSIFILAALMIQKRGFILDVAVVLVLIRAFQIQKEDLRTVRFQKQFRRIVSLAVMVLLLFLVYNRVPLVHDSVDSLIERFNSGDTTYSGRTDLYELAFSLYRGHMLRGIGWGAYRLNTLGFFGIADSSYAVHNVYIQLLCETGIIGLISFLIPAVVSVLYGIKKYRKIIKIGIITPKKASIETGLFLQLFFLAYCMSGNPLYDYNFCITYFIGILLTLIPIRDWER